MRRHSNPTGGSRRGKRERAFAARCAWITRKATESGQQLNKGAIREARTPFPNPEVCFKCYMGLELTKECLVEPTEQCKFIRRFADVLCCQHPDRAQFDAKLKKLPGYHDKHGGWVTSRRD